MGGLSFDDDFEEQWLSVEKYIGSIQDKLEDETTIKSCLRDIGNVIKKYVKQYAPRPSEHPSYSDAGKGNYKHIVDDIKSSVKKSRANGQYYVTVHGGKWTGYKWLWVNSGHVDEQGNKIEGCHFVDKAEVASEKDIETIVDKYIKDAMEKDDK